MMPASRRALLATAGLGLAAPALATGRPPRILMILFRGWEEACDGFRDYFAARRMPVDLVVRDVAQDLSRVPALVREARTMRPDLVYLWGTTLTMAVLGPWDAHDPDRHLSGIPAVFNIVTDPVGNRIVRSRAAPGRPVTGTEYIAPVAVQVEAIAAYRPFRRIAAPFNPLEQNSARVVEEMGQLLAARGAALQKLPVPVRADGRPDPSAIPALLREARAGGAEWLYIPPDTFLNDHRALLTQTAIAEGLPTFSASERFVAFADGLAGLVSRYTSVGAFTAFKAEQILTGGRDPGSIPVETLTRFSYQIRMETARLLGAYPPVGLLRIAEPV
ncbi:ABC transporter substrate-binding protein [Roseomonas sp. PWR1]|uniref:ABC transporter substrate-binding protein n=1 Tax=Roseomonas nitratireducens TaxID=2820810 RepID=A0ABS4ARH8_9PROT|nr:ABC transporter substrate-binding protein [Neoroseomonas nitratireducens]MBP0463941.1 ABC transporter substrate-binding protein [Neoroseomonas nitratireducens]